MSNSEQWFENAQKHLCTFTMAHRELMHLCINFEWIYLSHGFEYHILLLPLNSMHFSVHDDIKITAHGAPLCLCTFST